VDFYGAADDSLGQGVDFRKTASHASFQEHETRRSFFGDFSQSGCRCWQYLPGVNARSVAKMLAYDPQEELQENVFVFDRLTPDLLTSCEEGERFIQRFQFT
jgi:hypothetical protein